LRIAFFGDTTHPNTTGWLWDLRELFGLEVHAIDYVASPLLDRHVRQHVLKPPLKGKTRYLVSDIALRRVLREVQPDLLVAYRVISYGFAAARSGFHPLVLAAQGQNIVSPEVPRALGWCARYAVRHADMILAWAGHMEKALCKLGADPTRIRVLHRGIRTDVFDSAPSASRAPRIVTSRQLDPYYRTDLVVRAFAEIRRTGIDAELWIAGEGPERPRLEDMVRQLNLDGYVRFLGRLEPEALARAYREASVYASMVPTDGVSSSLLEAMSSGLVPVVIDNEPNRSWVTSDRDGILVPAGDVSGMARGLISALARDGPLSEAPDRNRCRIVADADRKTNLGIIVEWWRGLVEDTSSAGKGRKV